MESPRPVPRLRGYPHDPEFASLARTQRGQGRERRERPGHRLGPWPLATWLRRTGRSTPTTSDTSADLVASARSDRGRACCT